MIMLLMVLILTVEFHFRPVDTCGIGLGVTRTREFDSCGIGLINL